ncbi:tetratricopeptide repeat protein [Sphaerisporangium sp. NPDC049002]|uniref:AfsR/SARP family transcriptional regulator n=1 Tax=unclassified Sphaerisporangium TaxID=2630420 RepID=UPI0034026115
MDIRMLGSGVGLALSAQGMEPLPVPPKEQLALSVLLLSPNRPVAVDVIIDHLWGERPPPKARKDLASYMSRVRRRLRDAVGDRARIVARGCTYTLTVDPNTIDLERFRLLRRQATAVAESGDPEHAVRLLQDAEELWPGEALSGLPGDWARRMGEVLAEERMNAQRERIDLELRLGRHPQVLEELYRLVALHPADEALAAQLMTALYRSDRRTDALNLYRRVYTHLRELSATEPGQALRELHQRVLQGDSELAVTPVYRRGGTVPQPNTVPCDIPHFTGREREIESISALRRERDGNLVVAIQGMPGVGKSALAVHVAHRLAARYPDACLHLDLRAHDPVRPHLDAAAALSMLLRMLGIPPARIPQELGKRSAMWRAELAYRRAIVILDDALGPDQVKPLLGGSSAGLVIITTRARFDGTPGVRCVSLGVLPPGEAAELATRLADDDPDPGVIDEVVRLCGGLPLAITLRAGRTRISQRDGLTGMLGGVHRAQKTAGGVHREIDSAFELSYRDLTKEEQLAFRRLGLCPCRDVTAAVAAELCDTTPTRAQTMIDVLLRHHLLQRTAPGRYQFHDLIRVYAHDRARREDPERENRRAITRLLDHYLRTAEAAAQAVRLAQGCSGAAAGQEAASAAADGRQWLGEEWGTVLQLAQYAADHEWKAHCAGFMRVMAEFLDTEGHWEDAAAGHGVALRACREIGDSRGAAQASLDLGFVSFRTGRHNDALIHTENALSLYRSIADKHAEARCLDQIGVVCWASACYREALAHYEEAQAIYRSVDDVKGEADVLGHSGIVHWHLGRYQDSLDLLARALAAYRSIGHRRGEAKALNNMGDVHKHRGYHRDAIQLYQQSLEIFDQITGRQNHAILHNNLGNVHQYKGQFAAALECYRTAMATFQETGDRRNQADIFNSIGTTYLLMGGVDESLIHFQKARKLAEEIKDSYQNVRALVGIADVHGSAGRYTSALDICRQAITIARSIGDLYLEAQAHKRMADTFFYLDGPEAARISWRQAHTLLKQLDLPEAEDLNIRLQALGGVAFL